LEDVAVMAMPAATVAGAKAPGPSAYTTIPRQTGSACSTPSPVCDRLHPGPAIRLRQPAYPAIRLDPVHALPAGLGTV